MKEIAIYGGAFDMIHNGHVHVAETIRKNLDIPVWIVPAAHHPFGKKMTDWGHRYEMIKLAADHIRDLHIEDIEIDNLSGLSADMLEKLRAKYPDYNFRLIMGEDNAQILQSKWKSYERIVALHKLIVVPRKGYPSRVDWYNQAPHVSVNCDGIEVSSTQIRAMIASGNTEEVAKYLHPKVLQYIINHNLYI